MENRPRRRPSGFTLVELSIVLIIVALLSSGLLLGLSAQRTARNDSDARQQLDEAREALLGFAITNGRLPCPADPALASNGAGREDRPDASTSCSREHGVLPWATLGLPETDPWGQRLTYYAHNLYTAPLPADPSARASFTLDTIGNANVLNLPASDPASRTIASALPAVVVSHGHRGAGAYTATGSQLAGAAGEELENADADTSFIAHPPNDGFDDVVVWIVPGILKSRLVAAGRLP